MITKQDLEKIGFIENGEWNGRIYFVKNGFEIVIHNGLYRSNKRNWSGFGLKIESIEKLDKLYKKYINKKVKALEKEISKKKALLNTLLMNL